MRAIPILALTSCLLSGCAGLQSNVSGAFQCGAARGTCAPTMAIDDRALADIEHARQPSGEPTLVAALAGDMSDMTGYPLRKARVVFPGFTDEKGRVHEPYVVTVPLRDGWSGAEASPVPRTNSAPVVPMGAGTAGLRDAVAAPSGGDVPAQPVIVGRVVPAPPAPGNADQAGPASGKAAPQSFPASTTVHP